MPKLRLIISVLVAFACGQAQPKYTIQNLGTLSGMSTCFASALSQSGIVTGYCVGGNLAAGNSGFLYRGNMTYMTGQPQLFLLPAAVNNSGTWLAVT